MSGMSDEFVSSGRTNDINEAVGSRIISSGKTDYSYWAKAAPSNSETITLTPGRQLTRFRREYPDSVFCNASCKTTPAGLPRRGPRACATVECIQSSQTNSLRYKPGHLWSGDRSQEFL